MISTIFQPGKVATKVCILSCVHILFKIVYVPHTNNSPPPGGGGASHFENLCNKPLHEHYSDKWVTQLRGQQGHLT